MTTPEMSQQLAEIDGLGERFQELMQEATNGRLGRISWFRTDWQRGGARTGRSEFRVDDQKDPAQVVVKIPVGPSELNWNRRLQCIKPDDCDVTGRLYACGNSLGDYDLAWIVTERFSEGPLFGMRRPDAIALMADAAARFYRRMSEYPAEGELKNEDWNALIDRARTHLDANFVDQAQRWNGLLKTVQRGLDGWVREWQNREPREWCHGDLSPANAMSRSKEAKDPAMLIDFAEVRPGHWLEDAVYLERLYWLRPERYADSPPVPTIAQRRTHYGLKNGANVQRLADIRRVLLSSTAGAFLKTEGNPAFLSATLDQLEAALANLK